MSRFITLLLALALAACTASDAPASPSLVGTKWTLQSLAGTPIGDVRRAPTIHFQSDGQVGGHGGCNSWGGTYELKGSAIRFGQMRTTLMACEQGMDVESRFHAMLKQVRTVAATGGTLVFKDDGDRVLARFAPAANP
jgi:heat shock protein HslJ